MKNKVDFTIVLKKLFLKVTVLLNSISLQNK